MRFFSSEYEKEKAQHKKELVRNEFKVVGKYNIPLIKKQNILNSSLPDAFPTFCAGGAIVSVPIVILFVLLQKYFVFGETIRNFQI